MFFLLHLLMYRKNNYNLVMIKLHKTMILLMHSLHISLIKKKKALKMPAKVNKIKINKMSNLNSRISYSKIKLNKKRLSRNIAFINKCNKISNKIAKHNLKNKSNLFFLARLIRLWNLIRQTLVQLR